MNIKPMLAELDIPGIQRIGAIQARRVIDTPVPGLAGGLSQDLGAESARIMIEGSLAGDEPRDGFLESVRELFDAGEPVDFVADIITATEIFQVMIENLQVDELANSSNPFRYQLLLHQYVPPPEPETGGFGDGFPGVDELGLDLDLGLDLEAENLFDVLEIPDLLSIPDFGDPTPPLNNVLEGVSSSLEGLGSISDDLSSLFGGGD